MPGLTLDSVRVDPELTQISIFATNRLGYVAGQVFPVVPVDHDDGFVFSFERADTLRTDTAIRAPGSAYARKTIGLNKVPLALVNYGLEMELADEVRSSRGSPLATGEPFVRTLADDAGRRRDKAFLEAFVASGDTSPWANADFTGVASGPTGRQFIRWDASGATPIADVKAWKRDVHLATGMMPNVLLLGVKAFDAAAEAANVLSRLPDDSTRDVQAAVLAALMGLERIVISYAIENTANEGATYSGDYLLGEDGLLVYAPSSPAVLEPSAGYVFSWTEFDEVREDVGASGAPSIFTYRDEAHKQDIMRADMYCDMRITADYAGVRLVDMVS